MAVQDAIPTAANGMAAGKKQKSAGQQDVYESNGSKKARQQAE
eukprot:gene11434-5279_t